jgi:hypothetical protein
MYNHQSNNILEIYLYLHSMDIKDKITVQYNWRKIKK